MILSYSLILVDEFGQKWKAAFLKSDSITFVFLDKIGFLSGFHIRLKFFEEAIFTFKVFKCKFCAKFQSSLF